MRVAAAVVAGVPCARMQVAGRVCLVRRLVCALRVNRTPLSMVAPWITAATSYTEVLS